MKFSTTVSAKSAIFALSMTSVNRFPRAAVSILLAAALLLLPASAFADFRLDSSFLIDSLAVSPVDALGTAYITRAALGALGVEIAGSVLNLTPDDVVRAMWYGGGNTLPPVFTYAQNLAEYFSRQTIKIRPDSVTIDGVQYSDVWLPHDAADKFRTNAFDFITRYNISSESNGTFVSGYGYVYGVPVFQGSDGIYSQHYYFPFGASSFGECTATVSSSEFVLHLPPDRNIRGLSPSSYSPNTRFRVSSASSVDIQQYTTNGFAKLLTISYVTTSDPFDFTWVAGTVPADPLPTEDGLRLRVPASIVSALPQILDPDSPTYDADVASLISGLESSASAGTLTEPAFEAWDAPVPPASNTIANEPYSSLSGALSGISSLLGSISSSISQAAEAVISGDTGFFGNIVAALAAPFEPVFVIFRSGVGIWRYVVSWVGTISAPFTWSLSALGGAGSYFLSPIYAAAAAAVVLAVYKKFGR